MILKAVSLFLIGILVLGMFGKLRVTGLRRKFRRSAKCTSCGAPLVGKGPCACGGQ